MPTPPYTSVVYPVDVYGPVGPSTAVAPLEFPAVKFGDGIFVEEGTTNLVVNPSMEVDNASWGAAQPGTVLARSTVRGAVGSACMLVTFTNSQSGGGIGVPVTSGQTYTFTAYFWVPAGMPACFLSVQGVGVPGGASNSLQTTVNDKWQRLTTTFTANATGTCTMYCISAAAVASGGYFYYDAAQAENKAYATSFCDGSLGTGYSWSGTAHASTSTRASSNLVFPAPNISGRSLTYCTLLRIGRSEASVSGTRVLMRLSGAGGHTTDIEYNGNSVFGLAYDGTLRSSVVTGFTYAYGDTALVGVTLDAFGAPKVFFSLNGGTVQFGTLPLGTVMNVLTSVEIGGSTPYQSDNGQEQFLVYNSVLSASEIQALASAQGPTDYTDDSRIIFSAFTPSTRRQLRALSSQGSGYYRTKTRTPIDALIEPVASVPMYGYSPAIPATATHRISTPTGAGLGVGDYVALGVGGNNGITSILSVETPPGASDVYYARVV